MMKLFPQFNPVNLARWMVIALGITILFSPFFTNVIEIALFALCLFNETLRAKLANLKKQPLAIGVASFILMLVIGCFYSVADYKETLSSLWSWRKILLLPIALSLFEDHVWKNRFLDILVGFIFICSLLSIVSFAFGLSVYRFEPGIVIRNYATQGMVFAVSLFVIVMQLINQKKLIIKNEWPKVVYISSLLISLIFMTPGRSGYLALIVLTIYFVYQLIIFKKNYWAALFVSTMIPFLLIKSPMVNDRVKLGVDEISHVNAPHGQDTSMGLRLTAWKNAIEIIQEHSVLGVGTGGYETAFINHVRGQVGWEGFIHHDPHNQFMKILAELGIVGLLIFLSFLASTLLQKVKPFYFHLSLGVLIAWCGTSLFSSHFSTFTEGRFIYAWLGIMLASESNRIKS